MGSRRPLGRGLLRTEQLLDRLRADVRLADLARTPQLLGLICWLMGKQQDRASISRIELLERAVSGLLQSAVEGSGIAPDEAERLPLRVRAWLRTLAFEGLAVSDDARGRFSREEFLEYAERFADPDEASKLTRLARRSAWSSPRRAVTRTSSFCTRCFRSSSLQKRSYGQSTSPRPSTESSTRATAKRACVWRARF